MVTYTDYASETRMLNEANALTPLMHKRSAFEHEREVRVLVWRASFLVACGLQIEDAPADGALTMGLDWVVEDVIENVYVSPYAPEWYRDVVVGVLAKFAPALVPRLVWSHMKGVPLY